MSALEQKGEKETITQDFTKTQTGSYHINEFAAKIKPLIIELKHELNWNDKIENKEHKSLIFPTSDLINIIDFRNTLKDSDKYKKSSLTKHTKKVAVQFFYELSCNWEHKENRVYLDL